MGATSFKNGVDGCNIDRNRKTVVSGNLTLVAGDSGKAFEVKSGTSIFSLPATAVGLVYTFFYTGVDKGGQIQVSPVAADGIAAVGSAVVNKDLILASGTIRKGDFIKLVSGVGATGVTAWHVTDSRGILTKEA